MVKSDIKVQWLLRVRPTHHSNPTQSGTMFEFLRILLHGVLAVARANGLTRVNTTIRARSSIDIIIEKVSIRIVLAGVDGARRIRISQFYF